MKKLLIYLLLLAPVLGSGQIINSITMTRPSTGSGPFIGVSPTSVTGMLGNGGSAGTPVTVTVTFSGLTGVITAATSTNFEVSVDGGSTYGSSKTFSTGSPYSTLVRFTNGAPTGSNTGTLTLSTPGLSPNVVVSLSGFVSGSLTASLTTISLFSTAGIQGPGVSTLLVGSALGANNISVSAAPAGYVQSLDSATWITGGLTITPSGGSTSTKVFYALAAGNTAGPINGVSTISDAGAGVTPITVSLNGTVSASGSATLFAFSRTSRPLPTISGVTIVAMVGDPYISVISGSANGITCSSTSSGGSGAWQATGSPLVASNDSLGMLGSTMPGGGCPDSLLYRGWFSVSSSGNRLADSVHQTLSNPNLTITGLTTGHTYTFTIYSSVNTRYGFTTLVKARAVGNTSFVGPALTLKGNISNPIPFTMVPDGTGTVKIYLFTDSSPSNINTINALNVAP